MKQEQKYFLFESGIVLTNTLLKEGKSQTTEVATNTPMITLPRASVVKHPPKDISMDFKH